MAKTGLKLKRLVRNKPNKKWCMSELVNKKGQFQKTVENEIGMRKNDNVRGIEEQWTQLKDAIAVRTEEAFGYQKARTTKKE